MKIPRLGTPLKNLSGGNIQKLILAREFSRRPEMLIAAQPTRGEATLEQPGLIGVSLAKMLGKKPEIGYLIE